MGYKVFTSCVDIVGNACRPFTGTKKYVSTGAVDIDHIVDDEIEIYNFDKRPSRANLEADVGDVIFAKMQATKKTLLIDADLANNIYSTGFCAVRAKNGVLTNKCLYHLLTSNAFLHQKDKNCSGATQKAITNSGLSKIYIKVPDYSEQDSIARQLDSVNSIIKARQREIQELDNLIKARFVEMFGDPIRNPMGWNTYQLDECIERIDNGKSFVCSDKPRQGNYPAVLKLSAATYGDYRPGENKALLDESQFVTGAEVHSGDLLFTRKNTPELVGMAAYVQETPEKLMMPDLIFRLVTNEKMSPIFLWQLINCKEFRPVIQGISGGSAKSMSNISKERLGKICVICPPRKIQEQLEPFIAQVDKSKVVEQEDNYTLDNVA